nr:hypothetical protein [Burkholderia multivorans]
MNDDGDVVWEASYKAWGEAREVIARASKAAGTVAMNSLPFQARRVDDETGCTTTGIGIVTRRAAGLCRRTR